MSDYKISVLITFYNQEKYVDDCISSVLSQVTDFGYKIIVGDDGSTDNTIELVKSWKKKYPEMISYYINERIEGRKYVGGFRASQNRINLINKVDTPYFIFLDGDDYWTDNSKLQKQIDVLENPSNRDCVCCAHQMSVFFEGKNDLKELSHSFSTHRKIDVSEYWNDMYFHSDSIVFRSEYIDKIDYALLRDCFNDNLITFSFLKFGKVYYLPDNMACYRKNRSGIWAGERKKIGVLRDLMSFDIEIKINPKLRKQAERRHIYDFFLYYYWLKRLSSIDDDLVKSINEHNLSVSQRSLEGKNLMFNNVVLEFLYLFIVGITRLYYRFSISKSND